MVPILTVGVTFWWPTGELLLRGDGSLKPAGRSERDDCVPRSCQRRGCRERHVGRRVRHRKPTGRSRQVARPTGVRREIPGRPGWLGLRQPDPHIV